MAGVEIKVSVADWKKELANPAKAGEIQAYCHHWYVACPKGLIDVAHIPTNWGLIEVTGTTAAITREAPRLDTKPVDLLLVCAILRAVESCTVPKESVEDQICERVKKAIDGEQQRVQYEFDALKESVKAFREASGVDIGMRWDAGRIGAAVAFVQKVGIAGARDQAERLAKECDRAATALRGAITKLDAGVVESDDDDD